MNYQLIWLLLIVSTVASALSVGYIIGYRQGRADERNEAVHIEIKDAS